MEDTLRGLKQPYLSWEILVLILVLMEDTLRAFREVLSESEFESMS